MLDKLNKKSGQDRILSIRNKYGSLFYLRLDFYTNFVFKLVHFSVVKEVMFVNL